MSQNWEVASSGLSAEETVYRGERGVSGVTFPVPERPCSLHTGTGSLPGATGMPQDQMAYARGHVRSSTGQCGPAWLIREGAGKCSGEELNKLIPGALY